jgi:hypothetical protein
LHRQAASGHFRISRNVALHAQQGQQHQDAAFASLSMRVAKPAYFTEVMMISVQTGSDLAPKTVGGYSRRSCPPWS